MWSYRIYGNGGGGGGAGGADLTKVGTPVTVEARNSFKKGDEFYGVKKKGVTSEILGTNFTVGGGHTIYALSEDHTVAILNQTITRTSTIYNVGIFNEETNAFDIIEIPLPNLNSMMESISNRGLINEDGSLIIINNVKNRSYTYDAVIVIEINKTNKTGTAKYIDKLDIGTAVLDDTVQAVTLHTSSQKAQSCSRLTKNYYIGESIVYKSSGSNTSSNLRNAVYILRYENGTFTKALWSKVEKDSTFDSICGSTWTDENTLLVSAMTLSTSNVFLRKFVFDGDSVTYSENTTEFKDIRLSKNGKYIGCYTSPNYYVYQVNATDLTISKLYEGSSSGNCYPDDTGDYALINTDIINLKDKSILKSNVTMISRFFNIVNDKFVAGNYFWQLYLNDVEYVIYNSVEKLDDKDGICGIVPNDMTIGETGTAQKISNIENDLFDAGIPVTVEARNSFMKGDKFYGVKSEDAKDEILKTNTTVARGMGIVELSADNTVAVLNQTIGTQTKKYIVGVFNEELNCFDSVEIDLPDMSSIKATVSGRGHVNEDGSLIIIDGFMNSKGYYEGVLVVEFDKVNKTGIAKYFEDISINNYYYSGYKTNVELRSGNQVNANYTCVMGNYYIGYSKKFYYTYTKEDGTTVASTKSFAYRYIVQYKDGQFTDPLWQLIGGGSTGYYDILEDIYTYSWYDEKSFIITFRFYFSASSSPTRLYKFTISNDKLTSTYIENNNLKTGHFSKNGKFIGCNPSNSIIYSFNGSDMTLTQVFNSSTIKGACYPDDTGDYALINNGIIKLDDSTTLASNLAPKSRFFNIVNDKYLSGSNFVTLSNTTGEADYVAYNSIGDINTKNHIYGIVAEDLEIGDMGSAQKLYELEDADLIPENIKKDVNVLGTTGTFEIDQTKLNELYNWCGANGAVIPTDKNLTNLLDCMKSISNITSYTVSFNTLTDQTIEPQTIVHGHTISKVGYPTKEEHTFKYWTLNGDKFDENTPITSNITLEAYFESGYPTLMNYSTSSNSNYMLGVDTRPALSGTKPTSGSAYKNVVRSLTFLANGETPEEYYASWDVSEANDGTIILYYKSSDLYISSNAAKINLPSDCTNLFAGYNSSSFTGFYGLDILMSDTTTIMKNMFYGSKHNGELDLSSLDTSNVTDMSSMFSSCTNITSIIQNFDTSNVTDMTSMFSGCAALTELNTSEWKNSIITTQVTSIFYNCKLLKTIDFSGFTAVYKVGSFAQACAALEVLDIRNMPITAKANTSGLLANVPTTCTVYVKDTTAQTAIKGNYPNHNVVVASEYSDEYLDFTSSITPTTWNKVTLGTDYNATNDYGEWTVSAGSCMNTDYYPAYQVLDGSDSSEWESKTGDADKTFTITCPVDIKPTNFSCIHLRTSSDSYLEALNADTNEWETISYLVEAHDSAASKVTTSISFGDCYYKAFRFNFVPYTEGSYVRLFEVKITAGTIRKTQ